MFIFTKIDDSLISYPNLGFGGWVGGGRGWGGGGIKTLIKLLNPRALKISMLYENRLFHCLGEIFCVEFQREPLKFHTKYLTHTLKDVHFIHR